MRRLLASLPLVLLACGSDKSTAPRTLTCSTTEGTSQPATRIDLRIGESATILASAAEAACVQIDQPANTRYILGVINTDLSPSALASFQLRGLSPALAGTAADEVRSLSMPSPRTVSPDFQGGGGALHVRLLREDRELIRRRGNPRAALDERATARRAAVFRMVAPKTGDTLTLRIRDINVDRDCTQYDSVRARAVYVGSKSIVFEDINAPLHGTMDAYFRQVGSEFDDITFPMLVSNFGNPLAYDRTIGGAGKVLMLFSRVLNNKFPGIAGFVSACDFFPRSASNPADAAPVSNETAIFYAFVPDPDNPIRERRVSLARWRPFIRGVLAHEAKHIVSYAEKFARGANDLEEAWLEEATAQTASEIYQRTYSGQIWRGKGTYATTIGCEPPLGAVNHCSGDRPEVMRHHFTYLYDYLDGINHESPIGDNGAAYYGGSWLFVRWAVDQYATSESAFLREITQSSTQFGIDNLQARTGETYPNMITKWTLATVVANYLNATPVDSQLTVPSWDLRGIFAGMSRQLQGFAKAYPLVPLPLRSGEFVTPVNALPGGGATIFELSNTQRIRQLLQLQAIGGAALPSGSPLRIAVLRVR